MIVAAASAACAAENAAPAEQGRVRLVTVAEGLEHPWGIAFLPDGRALVTERPGRLRIVAQDGKVGDRRSKACPRWTRRGRAACSTSRSIRISTSNRLVYLSYAEPREGG